MKTLLITLLLTTAAHAHEIKGTLILKGTAKTEIMVDGIKTKCNVKVDEVKNTMTEDSFGNPAYRVWTKIELDGRSEESRNNRRVNRREINHKVDIRFTNMHVEGAGTAVSDENYIGETDKAASLKIDEKGRIRSVVFSVGAKPFICNF